MNFLAQTAARNLLLRVSIIAFSASATLLAYRHLVPKESPRLISQSRAVRRVLARAERINLRTSVTHEEGLLLTDAVPQPGAIALLPETPNRGHAVPILKHFQSQLGISVLDRSTVLNL